MAKTVGSAIDLLAVTAMRLVGSYPVIVAVARCTRPGAPATGGRRVREEVLGLNVRC